MKKVLIVALCVLSVAVLVFVGLLTKVYYDKTHPYYSYVPAPIRLSDNILMEYIKGYEYNKVRLKDMRTGKYTTPELQHVFITGYNSKDSLAVFRSLDYERGYLNIYTGKIVIPAQYSRAWNFSEGIAAVYKDGQVSFIHSSGEPAFSATFPIRYDDDYSEIAFQFHNGLCVMRTMDNKWGLINTQGKWVIEPKFNSIDAPYHGYRRAFDGRYYGLIARDGSFALPMTYDDIYRASDGKGWVLVKDGFAKEVDFHLQVLVPFLHDGIYPLSYVHSYFDQEDSEPLFFRYDVGSKSGVIDANGHVIIPAVYYFVRIVNDHLFEVEVTSGGERLLFNTKGQYVGKSTLS